jgi:benzil reductase ((S)-benzoin forming)
VQTIASPEFDSIDDLIVINNAGVLEPIGPTSRKPRPAVIANMNANFTSAILFVTEIVARFRAAPCR